MASRIFLVRHGETEWSRLGRHTSSTDLPLTDAGRSQAAALGRALAAGAFSLVLASPRQRARQTAALALPRARVIIDADLAEWNYGEYEGLTSQQIHSIRPTWNLWHDGCPGGESPSDVAARADRLIAAADATDGHAICFAHGHILRVIAARWIGLGPDAGALFALDTATISVLGREGPRRVIERWNARGDGAV